MGCASSRMQSPQLEDYAKPASRIVQNGIVQDVSTLASKLCNIARLAGAEQLKIYKENIIDVHSSTDDLGFVNPVTKADLVASELICKMLEQLDDNIPIMIEERKTEDFSKRKEYDYIWCCDPLDGTKEFIKKNGEFTVNIGLIWRSEPVFGVVYVPVKDIMYYGGTLEKFGSWKQTHKKEKSQQLHAASFSKLDENLTVVVSKSHSNKETMDFVKQFKNPIKKSKGSSLKLLMVAEGSAHCYPRFNGTYEWDTAAAHAIVNGAGGRVVVADMMQTFKDGKPQGLVKNPDGGKAVWYNKSCIKNPYFVVWGKTKENSNSSENNVSKYDTV